MMAAGGYRIGEFARRAGVSPELLRAWEQRYGLLNPVRTPGGFRVYGEEDAERVARMRRALEAGLPAAEAAKAAIAGAQSAGNLIEHTRSRLVRAIREFDESGAQSALDDGLAAFGLEIFVRELILATLADVGGDWERERIGISQEHFASHLIRGRLLSLARLWGRGGGPLALLACAPGEQHDISLLAFGLILRSYGWRILFLGADTPLATIDATARTAAPAATVLVSFDSGRIAMEGPALRRLARAFPLYLCGPGALPSLTKRLRLARLEDDLFEAARRLADTPAAHRWSAG